MGIIKTGSEGFKPGDLSPWGLFPNTLPVIQWYTPDVDTVLCLVVCVLLWHKFWVKISRQNLTKSQLLLQPSAQLNDGLHEYHNDQHWWLYRLLTSMAASKLLNIAYGSHSVIYNFAEVTFTFWKAVARKTLVRFYVCIFSTPLLVVLCSFSLMTRIIEGPLCITFACIFNLHSFSFQRETTRNPSLLCNFPRRNLTLPGSVR